MVESSIFINLFLSIALALSAHAQTAPPPTISSATSITSESAYASSSSSQMAWWNKTWDVVVVGSGPAGIIGKFPSVSSCRVWSALSATSPLLSFPIYTGYCGLHFADCFGKLPRSVLPPLPICLFSSWRLEAHPTCLLVEPLIRIG
jgi:hypothetical protein